MKKSLLFFLWFIAITFYYSCTKDTTNPPLSSSCIGVDAATNTYNIRIKAILDANCGYGGCHDAGTSSGNVTLDSYTPSKTAFENRNALCTIQQTGSCLAMPQGQPKLADSLIMYIQCWSENGYPQ